MTTNDQEPGTNDQFMNNINQQTVIRNKEMPVPSPCKLICRYDEDGLCAGCRRNREEITNWIIYSDHQKLEVFRKIKARKSGNL